MAPPFLCLRRGRGRTQIGAATILVGALWLAVAAAGDDAGLPLVEGEHLWAQSPDPGNPVACATCHWDAGAVRGWAPSFPKFRPLPLPAARVMTLLQANAEAVERHYRVSDPLPVATAITAYLTALGRDLPVTPGVTPDRPPLPGRLRALAASVTRGEQEFADRCRACHGPDESAAALRQFPRLVQGTPQSMEAYLEGHTRQPRLPWDGQAVADLMTYLASRLATERTGKNLDPARKE